MNALEFIGIGLGIAFIVLKIIGVITWPWIWVLAPFWVLAAIAVLEILIFLVVVIAKRSIDE